MAGSGLQFYVPPNALTALGTGDPSTRSRATPKRWRGVPEGTDADHFRDAGGKTHLEPMASQTPAMLRGGSSCPPDYRRRDAVVHDADAHIRKRPGASGEFCDNSATWLDYGRFSVFGPSPHLLKQTSRSTAGIFRSAPMVNSGS